MNSRNREAAGEEAAGGAGFDATPPDEEDTGASAGPGAVPDSPAETPSGAGGPEQGGFGFDDDVPPEGESPEESTDDQDFGVDDMEFGLGGDDDQVEPEEGPVQRTPVKKSNGGKLKWVALLIIAIILFGGGGFLHTKGGLAGLSGPATPEKPVKVVKITPLVVENKSLGKILLIEGTVQNFTEENLVVRNASGIIYNKARKRVKTQKAALKKIVTLEELKTITRDELTKKLSSAAPRGVLKPLGIMSVTAVVVNPPEDMGTAELQIIFQ